MRILYVLAENLNRTDGGIVHFLAVARGLQRLGHTVFIMGPQYSASMNRPPDLSGVYVPVLLRSIATFLLFQLLATVLFPFIVLLHRPEVVLVRGGTGVFWLMHLVARAFGVRVVLEANGVWWDEMISRGFPPWLARLVRWSSILQCRTAHRIISVTPGVGEALMRASGVPRHRVFVVQNGADPDEFDPSRRRAARARLGLGGDRVAVGMVGSFTPWHGLTETVQAIERLRPEVRSQIALFLVGHGDYWESVSKAVARARLEETVRLPGGASRDQVADYLAAFDVGLYINTDRLVGRFGNTPLKFWEYLAAGLPVIASDNCNLTPIMREHGFGWVIQDTSPEALAAVIDEVWQRRGELAAIGRRNREIVRRKFSWLAVSRQVADVLQGRPSAEAGGEP